MAEVAGLIVGGVSLSALFDQCMNIIHYVDSGRHCGDAQQDAALMLTLLGGRLSRWERAYRSVRAESSTEEEGEDAERYLLQIQKRLQDAEELGKRYSIETPTVTSSSVSTRSRAVSELVHRLREKILVGADGVSLGKRTRWAVRDEGRMNSLIEKLDRLITNLEQLSTGLQERRTHIATVDASAVIETFDKESDAEALEALKAAAAKVDQNFNVAAAARSNRYRNIQTRDSAKILAGNSYTAEYVRAGGVVGQGGGHQYENIFTSEQASVQMGDSFGGKGIFD